MARPHALITFLLVPALSLSLVACGSNAWTAESVDAALLTSADFDFDARVAEEKAAFDDAEEGDTLFWGSDECTATAKVEQTLKRADELGSAAYEERNDGQSDFNVKQQVFQLESAEAATEFVDVVTKALNNEDCSYSDYASTGGVTAYIDNEVDNLRDLQDAFGLIADASVVWDSTYNSIFSGIFTVAVEEEGGGVVASRGSAVLLLTYETDTDEDVDDMVTRRDLEDAIEKSLVRFFPE